MELTSALGIIAAFLLGVLTTAFVNTRAARISRDRVDGRIARKAISHLPTPFVFPNVIWTSNRGPQPVQSDQAFDDGLADFLASQSSVLVISGSYGSGKSVLAKYLVSRIASRQAQFSNTLPIYINTFKMTANGVAEEVFREVTEGGQLMTPPGYYEAITRKGTVFVFDALDQLPYRPGSENRIDAILDTVDWITKSAGDTRVILVVRSEFLDYIRSYDRNLLTDPSVPQIEVLGFPKPARIKQFVEQVDRDKPSARWQALERLLKQDPKLIEVFARPIVLSQFLKIPVALLAAMGSTGTSLASVFDLSMRRFDDADLKVLEAVAVQMFMNNTYSMRFRKNRGTLPPEADLSLAASRTGVLEIHNDECHFVHATFRDFLVARTYVKAIEEHRLEALSACTNNYLVSEFVAGLIDETTLSELLSECHDSDNVILRINVMDILSELEPEHLKSIAKSYYINELVRTSGEGMSDYRLVVCSIAGVLGDSGAIDEVITYAQTIGVTAFLEQYFPTRNKFAYYDGKVDRCISEWINIVKQDKYGETRRFVAFMLGEMRATRAAVTLQAVAESSEPESLRRAAAIACSKLERI